MKVTVRRELFSASLFCHSIALNSISVGKPWDMEPGDPSWNSCSVTDWPCDDTRDKEQKFS